MAENRNMSTEEAPSPPTPQGTAVPFSTIVSEYYSRIDALDHDWVIALFAAHAVYLRTGRRYNGRPRIEHFFRRERKITGLHRLHDLYEDPAAATVCAVGQFDGVGEAGDRRAVDFADIWKFDHARCVVMRQTFLAMGHAYVER